MANNKVLTTFLVCCGSVVHGRNDQAIGILVMLLGWDTAVHVGDQPELQKSMIVGEGTCLQCCVVAFRVLQERICIPGSENYDFLQEAAAERVVLKAKNQVSW